MTFGADTVRKENQCESSYIVRTVNVIDTMKPIIGLQKASGEGYDVVDPAGGVSSVTYKHHAGKPNPAGDHFMAQASSVSGWVVAGMAAMVAGVAMIATSAKTTTTTDVPV